MYFDPCQEKAETLSSGYASSSMRTENLISVINNLERKNELPTKAKVISKLFITKLVNLSFSNSYKTSSSTLSENILQLIKTINFNLNLNYNPSKNLIIYLKNKKDKLFNN